MDWLLVVLTTAVMLLGMVGVIVPVLPGLLLVWLGASGLVLITASGPAGWAVVALLTLLFALGTAATIWLPAQRGRQHGVPFTSLLAAIVGAIVGFFIVPVLGLLIGAAVGLVVAEAARLRGWEPAWRSLKRVAAGYGIGVLIELAIGTLMIGIALLTAFVNA
jgi:uncharacterized protein